MTFNSPLAWFEIITQDLERAITFYENAFAVKLNRHNDEHMQMALFPYQEGFTGGALVYSQCYSDHKAGPGTTIIYLNTDSVTKQLEKIKQYGGEEVFPVTCIGENGYIAGFKDTEGNHIGIWSEKS